MVEDVVGGKRSGLGLQKNQYLVNGESNQKIVTSKKDRKFNSGPNPPHSTFKTCPINVCLSIENIDSYLLFFYTNLLIMIDPLTLAINRPQKWIPQDKIPIEKYIT